MPTDTTYQVTFKTGDRPNAGTTAKVQFELFGDQGKTEPIQLSEDRSLRLFERGNSDKFKVDTKDVGKVCIVIKRVCARDTGNWANTAQSIVFE